MFPYEQNSRNLWVTPLANLLIKGKMKNSDRETSLYHGPSSDCSKTIQRELMRIIRYTVDREHKKPEWLRMLLDRHIRAIAQNLLGFKSPNKVTYPSQGRSPQNATVGPSPIHFDGVKETRK